MDNPLFWSKPSVGKHFQVDTGGTLTTDLVAYWKMEDVNDYIGTNNFTNTTGIFGSGKVNNCWIGDGASAYMSTNTVTTGSSTSFAFWLYKTSDVDHCYFTEGDYTTACLCFFASNRIQFRFGANNEVMTGTNPISNNAWHHIVCTITGTTGTIFIDGSQVATGTVNPKTSSGAYFMIGKLGSLNIYYLPGRIDEFGIWNKVLTTQEIADLYNSGSGQTMIS